MTSVISRTIDRRLSFIALFNTGWIQFIPIVRRTTDGGVTPDPSVAMTTAVSSAPSLTSGCPATVGSLEVQLFAELSHTWRGGEANVCQLAPTCAVSLILEHDGSVYSCDHFVSPEHRLGNLSSQTLREMARLAGTNAASAGQT